MNEQSIAIIGQGAADERLTGLSVVVVHTSLPNQRGVQCYSGEKVPHETLQTRGEELE